MKQLEQEAHRAAGQIFLVTSNTQLRTVGCDWLRYCAADVFLNICSPLCKKIYLGPQIWKRFPPFVMFASASLTVCSSVLSDMICASFSLIGLFTLWMCNVLQVLFDKLCLHEQCENRKLPKTLNKQQQSTSEAAVWLFQTHRGVSLDPWSFFIPVFFQCLHVQRNTNSQASSLICSSLLLGVLVVLIIYWLQVHLPTHSADALKYLPSKGQKKIWK